MTDLAGCVSEPVSPYGAVDSDLSRKVLKSGGSLSKWSVFARETFQNSNDQRLSDNEAIEFQVRLIQAPQSAISFLKKTFSQDGAFNSDSNLGLSKDTIVKNILLVVDSNTKGLTGSRDPRLANLEQSNFNNFFFFTGQLQKKTVGGGTFGIGRNVLFQASKHRTIFVYSAFEHDGKTSRIFMGMSVSSPFDDKGLRYTGKHWWGKESSTEGSVTIEAFEDDEAKEAASTFGISEYLETNTGTVIAILDPEFDDVETEMKEIADALLINSWPHLLANKDGVKSANITVDLMGTEVPVPDPLSNDSPVRNFVLSYLNTSKGRQIFEEQLQFRGSLANLIDFKVEKKILGNLRWVNSLAAQIELSEEQAEQNWRLGFTPENSIALMRGAKTIVRYLPVAKPSDGSVVQGVFVASQDYEQLFRASENATHDDWLSSALSLPRGSGDPVRQLKDKLQDVFNKLSNNSLLPVTEDEIPLEAAELLGKLVEGLGVTGGVSLPPGPGPGPGPGPSPTGSKTVKFKISGIPRITEKNDDYCQGEFCFNPVGSFDPEKSYKFQINARIWLGDGFETSAPEGGGVAKVLAATVQGIKNGGSAAIDIKTEQHGKDLVGITKLVVVVRYPLDVQISCSAIGIQVEK